MLGERIGRGTSLDVHKSTDSRGMPIVQKVSRHPEITTEDVFVRQAKRRSKVNESMGQFPALHPKFPNINLTIDEETTYIRQEFIPDHIPIADLDINSLSLNTRLCILAIALCNDNLDIFGTDPKYSISLPFNIPPEVKTRLDTFLSYVNALNPRRGTNLGIRESTGEVCMIDVDDENKGGRNLKLKALAAIGLPFQKYFTNRLIKDLLSTIPIFSLEGKDFVENIDNFLVQMERETKATPEDISITIANLIKITVSNHKEAQIIQDLKAFVENENFVLGMAEIFEKFEELLSKTNSDLMHPPSITFKERLELNKIELEKRKKTIRDQITKLESTARHKIKKIGACLKNIVDTPDTDTHTNGLSVNKIRKNITIANKIIENLTDTKVEFMIPQNITNGRRHAAMQINGILNGLQIFGNGPLLMRKHPSILLKNLQNNISWLGQEPGKHTKFMFGPQELPEAV